MKNLNGMEKSFWEYHFAYDHRLSAWKNEVLFTWQWWFGTAVTILPWVLWFFFRKRNSTGRLLFSGTFVALISLSLDNIGFQLGAWTYLKPVFPVIPAYIPFDLALMPVVVMFLIQIFSKRDPWLIGTAFGAVTSFIGEPFFQLIKIYHPVHWNSFYSFPIYCLVYLFAYRLATGKSFTPLN